MGRNQTKLSNCVVGYLANNGFKTITLSTSIIAENETGEELMASILHTFKECKKLLDMWRAVTERMFPGRQDLLDKIPSSSDLTLAKLSQWTARS